MNLYASSFSYFLYLAGEDLGITNLNINLIHIFIYIYL